MPEDALRGLLRRTWAKRAPGWVRFARTLSRSPAEAENIVSDAVFRTLQASPSLQSEREVNAYVLRAIRNTTYRYRARRRARKTLFYRLRRERGPLADSALDVLIEIEERAHRATVHCAIMEALASLPPELRQVVELHILKEPALSFREIAERQGVAHQTVHERLNRAIAILARAAKSVSRG